MNNVSFNGYSCAICGSWVNGGSMHVCLGRSYGPPAATIQPDAMAMALGRIEALLQQIQRDVEGLKKA